MYRQFKELADVDITRDPMEVGPTCHYMMGGVRVDPESQESTVPGLFAAGEVAGGMHGANRLGGNSLSDLLVFGKRAGEFAARHAQEKAAFPAINPDEVEAAARASLAPFDPPDGENPYAIHEDLRTMMQRRVGIVRSAEDLEFALDALAALRDRARRVKAGGNIQFNPGWHLALDLKNMIDISEAVTHAAHARTESRGAHTREDYPGSDPEWGRRNVIIRRSGDGVEVALAPLPEMPADLKQLLNANVPETGGER
jgi:succinate dehydrogenase / fumarate reductase flavoprotein subunit